MSNAYVRLVAVKNNHELCRYKLDGEGKNRFTSKGLIFAKLNRSPMGSWLLQAEGKEADGTTANSTDMKKKVGITHSHPIPGGGDYNGGGGYKSPGLQAPGSGGGSTEEAGCCVIT